MMNLRPFHLTSETTYIEIDHDTFGELITLSCVTYYVYYTVSKK